MTIGSAAPSRPSKADARLLASLERAFAVHAGDDARIDPAELQRALGLRSDVIASRILRILDRDGDGTIDKREFVDAVRKLVTGSDRDRLSFAFRLHDDDGDGLLSMGELQRMIAISLAESEIVERPTQPASQLARVLLTTADTNGDGKISFEEFEAVAMKRPALLEKMIQSEAIWLSPNEDILAAIEGDGDVADRFTRFRGSIDGTVLPRLWVAAWLVGNVALFAIHFGVRLGAQASVATPGHSNVWMLLGRSLGVCLDFNGALILLPMLRRLLTKVRASWLGRVVPVDEAVEFHRIVGHAMFGLAVAHAAAFGAAYAVGHAGRPFVGLFANVRGATGIGLLVVFAVMWIFALPFVRRSRHFELFARTHTLYVAWLALVIAHGPPFLLWGGAGILGLVVEMLFRARKRARASTVVSSEALRSGVTRLEIERPPGFDFAPGDYAFVRIPAVARSEWHPFTISSAPERSNLTFHVRSLGNWTGALRRHVEASEAPLVAHVDGPYGSPSAHIFESRFAVLIGAGIGVTPFASVLESIVLAANSPSESRRASKLERTHFFWLNRDQYSFEWFVDLLRDLEQKDGRGALDIHLCMTGARGGAISLGLELARQIMRAAGRSDMITGLRMHTHVGPPDWPRLLGDLASRHAPHRVDVYFCGPPGLAAKLRPICERLGMPFREERF